MAIEFHCDHCDHLIKTAEDNAGKRGKCPHCHQSVYIPTPRDKIEPLRLAPVDQDEERERRRLRDEAQQLTRALSDDKAELPPDTTPPPPSASMDDPRLPSDMETLIIEYVLAMANGKLNEAEEHAAEIRRDLSRADEFIQRLTMDELPPARLADVPRPVLAGFLRQLRG